MPMRVVYDLHDDSGTQEILRKSRFGKDRESVGTDEWWESIRLGQIPIRVVEGKISEVWSGSGSDDPKFSVIDPGGKCHKWLYPGWNLDWPRSLDLDENKQVEISYFDLDPHSPDDEDLTSRVLLLIRVEVPWGLIF